MNNNLNLLYIEDDTIIRENYCFVLNKMFQNVLVGTSYDDAIELLDSNEINIAIIDIQLEGVKTGIDIIKYIRNKDLNMKIIVTSAYSTVENLLKISSLNLSSFLVKPIKKDELLAAINKGIKEFETIKVSKLDKLSLKESYLWDFEKKELSKENELIQLTKMEKEILQVIFTNPTIELTYDYLIDEIWGFDEKSHHKTLRTLMYSLRKKLPKDTIKTIYNVGYKFE